MTRPFNKLHAQCGMPYGQRDPQSGPARVGIWNARGGFPLVGCRWNAHVDRDIECSWTDDGYVYGSDHPDYTDLVMVAGPVVVQGLPVFADDVLVCAYGMFEVSPQLYFEYLPLVMQYLRWPTDEEREAFTTEYADVPMSYLAHRVLRNSSVYDEELLQVMRNDNCNLLSRSWAEFKAVAIRAESARLQNWVAKNFKE